MFCENCGSQIPDGSRFCTECGTPIASAPPIQVPDARNIDNGSPIPPSEPAQSPSGETPWQQPQQTVRQPDAAWQPSAAQNDLGYTTVGAGSRPAYNVPGSAAASGQASWDPDRSKASSKPVTKQWWFWLIIGLVIVAVIIAAAFFLLKAHTSDKPEQPSGSGDIRTSLGAVGDAATSKKDEPEAKPEIVDEPKPEAPEIEIPEVEVPEVNLPGTQTIDPAVQALADEVDAYLTEEGILHTVDADEDAWIFVYIWYDGIDELTDAAALDGDADAIAEWDDDIEYMCGLSEDIRTSLDSIGKTEGVAVVGIQSDVDEDVIIAYAFDGEVVYDWVNDIDLISELFED